ncbi:hypothetical protein LCGC14_1768770 [marine sediment metagenome]|uniref:Uncharacterized protein n=1 Tax=marine sediment metagenome TaxID=412755 RepID=A0A0F9HLE2_9ZZZZ
MFCWRCGAKLTVDPLPRGIWWCFDCGARYEQITTRGAPALVQYGPPRGMTKFAAEWYEPFRPQSGTRVPL